MPVRGRLARILIAVALAWSTQACSSEDAQTPAPPDMSAMPIAPPGGAVTPPGGAPPATPGATAGTSAPTAGAGMGAPAQLMDMEMAPATPPANDPATPDPCKDFVVSRRAPCHDDPNLCNIDSGYIGDEYCLLPPAPDEGLQVHFGPADYKNAAEVEKSATRPTSR